MRASKLYPFLIPANGSINLLVSGDYFKIKSATGSISVTGDSFGTLAGILPGQGLRDTDFTRLTLTDETGSPNAGYVLVSDGTFVDDRVTGEVSVIDGEKARTLAGGMYGGTPFSVVPSATNYSIVQLWNPAGSNKNLIVTQSSASVSSAAAVNWFWENTARTNDVTAVRAANKKAGAAMGVGTVRWDTGSAVAPTFALGQLYSAFVQTNTVVNWGIKGAVVVPPGFGLSVLDNILNTALVVNYEWFEENVT